MMKIQLMFKKAYLKIPDKNAFGFSVEWRINFCGLNAKKNHPCRRTVAHCWEDKEFHAFYKDISSKESIIAQLEFEHACLEAAVKS